MFIHRRGGYKTKSTKEVSTSTESDVQYSNVSEIQRAGDAATAAENSYEPLQLHQLQHLFHSRNAVAPYVELIQTA